MIHARYVGQRPDLRGLNALVRSDPDDSAFVLAQFDNMDTELGNNWHKFFASDFVPLGTA